MRRLNGAVLPPGLAPFDLADRGLTLGDGLFETIAVFGGRPALLDAHLNRMVEAASEIRLPVSHAMLAREVQAVAGDGDGVIRLTVTRGPGARGLAIPEDAAPAVIASLSPMPKTPASIRLATVETRRNPTSFASRAKTLSYIDSVLAFDEARQRRADVDDALMLNTHGRVASTAMMNLFVLHGRELATPPVSEGVLPGCVRKLVLEVARELGMEPVERPVERDELARAHLVFATNSVRLVTPVLSVDSTDLTVAAVVAEIWKAVAARCGARLR